MALIAVLDGRMIGLASYDRELDKDGRGGRLCASPTSTRRGIGTQLLRLLTNHARSQGVRHFEAFVPLRSADDEVVPKLGI